MADAAPPEVALRKELTGAAQPDGGGGAPCAPADAHDAAGSAPHASATPLLERLLEALDPRAHRGGDGGFAFSALDDASIPEINGSVAVPPPAPPGSRRSASATLRTLAAYAGPGVLVSVGYMDPGNWCVARGVTGRAARRPDGARSRPPLAPRALRSTDIAGGSAFGYDLLFVVLTSNVRRAPRAARRTRAVLRAPPLVFFFVRARRAFAHTRARAPDGRRPAPPPDPRAHGS